MRTIVMVLVSAAACGCADRAPVAAPSSVTITFGGDAAAVGRLVSVPSGDSLTALHADDQAVYVGGRRLADSDGGTRRSGFLRAVSADGTVVDELWTGAGTPSLVGGNADLLGFVTDDDDLGTGRSETLRCLAKAGGPAAVAATFLGHEMVNSLALVDGSLYYSTIFDNTSASIGNLGLVDLATLARTILAPSVPSGPLVVSSQRLTWPVILDVYQMSRGGGPVETVWTSRPAVVRAMALSPDQRSVYVAEDDRIVRLRDGAASDFALDEPQPRKLMADGSFLYWTRSDDTTMAQLVAASVDTGTVQVLTTLSVHGSLAQDDRRVYWIDPSAPAVMYAVKPSAVANGHP